MIRAPIKIFLLIVWAGLWILPVWIVKLCGKLEWRDRFMMICSSGLLRIVGIRLKVTGKLSEDRPLLLVTNHLSYFDIPLIASHAPVRFTPKSEIAGWPVIGFICRLTDCIFVHRRSDRIKENAGTMRDALAKGEVISLFPESTTGNGLYVLPFRSSFFNLAEEGIADKKLFVQPAAFTYTRIGRLPIDSTQWPRIAWVGDTYMFPHLWKFLGLGALDAELIFLPPVTIEEYGDRKRLAAYCQQVISEAIQSVRSQYPPPQISGFSAWMAKWSKPKS